MIRNFSNKDSINYKRVFLDLDGTITDSGTGCVNGVRYMFEQIGYEENDEKKLLAFVGPPVRHHLVREYGFSEKDALSAYDFYKQYYEDIGVFESQLYDGIKEAIENIKQSGKTVYLATSKQEYLAVPTLKRFELFDLFTDVFAARHDLGVFDKIDVLNRAVNLLGEAPSDSVMVGDRSYDIVGGKHVGFDTIGVLYGYGDLRELTDAGSDYIVDSIEDLSMMLGRNN